MLFRSSVRMPALRACHRVRVVSVDQRLFTQYLPGAELRLHARVYSAQAPERQMLFEAVEPLGPADVLVLDWDIGFCRRCDKANGWVADTGVLAKPPG